MPISEDKTNVTINFEWSHKDGELTIQGKYYILNGVPTLSISNDNGENWYNFPYTFFEETNTFISSQLGQNKPQVMMRQNEGVPSQQKHVQPKKEIAPQQSTGVRSAMLPVPEVQTENTDEEEEPQRAEVADMNPLETLGHIANMMPQSVNENTARKTAKERIESLKEKINRPVIRRDAETAKNLRGVNTEKTIKRL